MYDPRNTEFTFRYVPLCDKFRCKFDEIIWNCLPTPCKVGYGFMVSLCVLLIFMISIGNIVVILVYVKRLKKRDVLSRAQLYYKLSLASADMLMGCVVCPCYVSLFCFNFLGKYTWTRLANEGLISQSEVWGSYYRPRSFRLLYEFSGITAMTSWTVSIATLVAASVDRLVAVTKPMSYVSEKGCGSRFTSKIVVAVTWVSGLGIGFGISLAPGLEYGGWMVVVFSSASYDALYLGVAMIVTPLLLLWLVNISTFIIIRRKPATSVNGGLELRMVNHTEDIQLTVAVDGADVSTDAVGDVSNKDEPENRESESSSAASRHRHLAVTIFLIVGGFTVAFLPMLITTIVSLNYELGSSWHDTAVAWSTILCVSNSFWNVFIYSMRYEEFRADAKGYLRKTVKYLFCPRS